MYILDSGGQAPGFFFCSTTKLALYHFGEIRLLVVFVNTAFAQHMADGDRDSD
jgi:hypothetical protein